MKYYLDCQITQKPPGQRLYIVYVHDGVTLSAVYRRCTRQAIAALILNHHFLQTRNNGYWIRCHEEDVLAEAAANAHGFAARVFPHTDTWQTEFDDHLIRAEMCRPLISN